MDIRLVVEKGKTRTRTLRLRTPQTVVGRQYGCQIRIPSAQVSRRHCVLCFQDGYLMAEDLGSANGTFLNGRRIADCEVVRPGDQLGIGPLQFVVEYELSPAALERLRHRSPGRARAVEPVEDLPVAEEVLDWPTADERPKVQPGTNKKAPPGPVEPASAMSNDEALPIAVPFDEESWQLPESDELRSILSQMEESKHPPKSPRR